MDDLDDLLGGVQPLEDVGAECLLLDRLDELADDLQADVRFEEGDPDLAQGDLEVFFGDPAPAAQLLEDAIQPVRQTLEHGRPLLIALSPPTSLDPASGELPSHRTAENRCRT